MEISNYKFISTLVGGNLMLFISNALPKHKHFGKETNTNIWYYLMILDLFVILKLCSYVFCFIKMSGSPRMLSLTKKLLTGWVDTWHSYMPLSRPCRYFIWKRKMFIFYRVIFCLFHIGLCHSQDRRNHQMCFV